jgi:hypothetical protein
MTSNEPGDAGPAPSERSGVRLRTWLIGLFVAAVGAALTNVLTGGISSAVESGWDALTGNSDEDPAPLTVSARSEPGRRSAFVFEKRLSALSPPPADLSGEARLSWAERNGGIDAFATPVQVVVQGRTATSVILLGLDIEVVSRKRPPAGTLLRPEGAGGIGVRYFDVNLDQRSPEAVLGQLNEPRPGERPINFPYKVSRSDPEVFTIYGHADRCDCRWIAKLRWESGGEDGTTVIRDGDQPFRTASGSAARDEL